MSALSSALPFPIFTCRSPSGQIFRKPKKGNCLPQSLMSGKTERATYKVYVGNLGNNGSKKELEREFERFGKLHDVWVARNPPGFAFVEFVEYHDAEDACRSLDGARICGERVRVEMARNRNRGGGGGGGGSCRSDYRDDRQTHGGGGRHYDDRGGSDRYDDRSRSPYRSPPRRGRGRSPYVDR